MIPLKDQDLLRQKFQQEMMSTVRIDMFSERSTGGLLLPGRKPCQNCKPTQEMLKELASLSPRISLNIHLLTENHELAASLNADKIPAIILRDKNDRSLHFYGMPSGSEFPSFIETIIDLSQGKSLLSEETISGLRKIKKDINLQVMITPTCPYCPHMARLAYQFSLASPYINTHVIEISEFPELAQRYQVRSVPTIIINEKISMPGAIDEERLLNQLIKTANGDSITEMEIEGGPSTPALPETQSETSRATPPESGIILP